MVALGQWTRFIDEPDLATWYPWPPGLGADLEAFQPDGTELTPFSPQRFARMHDEAERYAAASVARWRLAYHGPRHFRQVENDGMNAVTVLEGLRGERFPLLVKQTLGIALRLHDCHHTGSTFRVTYPERVWRPELGLQVSSEWVSSVAVDELAKGWGWRPPARAFAAMVIWCSTFGGATPLGQKLGIPVVAPRGLWGRLMRAADICPPPDLPSCIDSGLTANFSEVPAMPPPRTWGEMVADLIDFQGYRRHTLALLDEAAGVSLTTALGWQRRLDQVNDRLTRLATGHHEEVQLLRSALERHNVKLG